MNSDQNNQTVRAANELLNVALNKIQGTFTGEPEMIPLVNDPENECSEVLFTLTHEGQNYDIIVVPASE